MWIDHGYCLRSNARRYGLRSNSQKSRSGKRVCSGKVPGAQKKPKAVKPKEDLFVEDSAHCFAIAALSYLREKGANFDLVKPGGYEGDIVSGGMLFHLNFKAKYADDPNTPVQTFFAQVTCSRSSGYKDVKVGCCVSLGKSDTLPKKPDSRGCLFCSEFVYHPIGGCKGIELGWPDWSSWNEMVKSRHDLAMK